MLNKKEKTIKPNLKQPTFLKSTSNNFILLARTHFKGISFILINIIIPILISTSLLSIMPPKAALMWITFMTMTFSGLATYGVVVFVFDKSTFIKNVNLSSAKSTSIYTSVFLLVGVSIFISFIIGIMWSVILDDIGFTMRSFMSNTNGINKVSSNKMMWGNLFVTGEMWYYFLEQVALCFAISYFVEKIFVTQKNFYLFLFGYMLAGIVLSGIFSTTLYLTMDGVVDVIDSNNIDHAMVGSGLILEPFCWGGTLWKMGQFVPHFGANQLAINISSKISYREFNFIPDYSFKIKNGWNDISIFQFIFVNWKIAYYALVPWVWILGLIFIASKFGKKE